MPATSLERTSGAMIILIKRRKTSLIRALYPEISFEVCGSGHVMLHSYPTAISSNISLRMEVVSLDCIAPPPNRRA